MRHPAGADCIRCFTVAPPPVTVRRRERGGKGSAGGAVWERRVVTDPNATRLAERRRLCAGLGLAALGTLGTLGTLGGAVPALAQVNLTTGDGTPVRTIEVPFVVTPNDIVTTMLDLAEVTSKDTVFDLGCGDGRIVIAAAKQRGARGVGVEIDEKLVETARVDAVRAGVADRVRIDQGDLFEMDFRGATVVILYLSESINLRLWLKFVKELEPGARIVSHKFMMGDRTPEKVVPAGINHLYLWRIPQTGEKK
jgi:SAM-dependent methyltransferase